MTNNLKSLIAKLSSANHTALESAVGLCVSRSHFNIEVDHWIYKLLENNDSDFLLAIKKLNINAVQLQLDTNRALDRLRTGNVKTPGFSPEILSWIEAAWLLTSLEFDNQAINGPILLLALINDDNMSRIANAISPEFTKISKENLKSYIQNTTTENPAHSHNTGSSSLSFGNNANGALATYTINLTEAARNNNLDPVFGRDPEIRQMIDILLRKRQNNPILVGEAGVGKTALVEGLALRIAHGLVPPILKDVNIHTLDLTLLQAGAGVKGEFENRLKNVINEVKKSVKPIILFIDEAHNMIGSGGTAGQGDAANLLKPALARGELRTIAATTWAEYKKYFEKDAALTRRFQTVKVDEPTEENAIGMMRALSSHLQAHHHVTILDEAIIASVKLSKRYIPDRQLPDKSLSLLDTACAKVSLTQSTTPDKIEEIDQKLLNIDNETLMLNKEMDFGIDHQARVAELSERRKTYVIEHEALSLQWNSEKELINRIHAIYQILPKATFSKSDNTSTAESIYNTKSKEDLINELQDLKQQLLQLQGKSGLMYTNVDQQVVAEVISNWTGIPAGRMVCDELKALLNLEESLEKRVVGQTHAIREMVKRIHISRANLANPNKPIGVFLLAGSSGTGKTETALALAEMLYGSEKNITVINMSEFKEEHKVSVLVGSPPGYIGYGEGGVLTEAVRRKPYSIILLDEIEKAHPGVQEVFYQVFDKGMIMDGEGREIDFKNTLIIMTTNVGSRALVDSELDFQNQSPESILLSLLDTVTPDLSRAFKPAFLGRTTIIPYLPLSDAVLEKIIHLQLVQVKNRIQEHYRCNFGYSAKVVEYIISLCDEVEIGARRIEHIINGKLLPEISKKCLALLANEEVIGDIFLDLDPENNFVMQ